jgi:pyruvate-formate lyase-activating enzyme
VFVKSKDREFTKFKPCSCVEIPGSLRTNMKVASCLLGAPYCVVAVSLMMEAYMSVVYFTTPFQ